MLIDKMGAYMIRTSTINDCDAIYNLICELENIALPREVFGDIYTEQLGCENHICLVYEADGKVVGVLNMRFERQLHHSERIAEIMEFCVSGEYRGRGIGKELLAAAREAAADGGCAQLELATNQGRTDAHRFYQREGMVNTHFKFTMRL